MWRVEGKRSRVECECRESRVQVIFKKGNITCTNITTSQSTRFPTKTH